MKEKIVIGLIGEAGSGKDTTVGYLERKNESKGFRYSNVLKKALAVFFEPKEITREKMIWLSNVLRGKYGNQVISEALRKMIKKAPEKLIVLDGLRIADDVAFLRSFKKSFLIYVTLDQKERWRRNSKRGERPDDAISFEEFQKMELAETEIQIPNLGKNADYRIENSGTKEELFEKIDEIIAKLS